MREHSLRSDHRQQRPPPLDVYKVYDLFVMIFFLERAGGAPAERLPLRIHLNRRPSNRPLIGENRGPSIS